MRTLGGIILAAATLAAGPAAAQQGWPREPMIIGVGFNSCREVLAAPADARRDAMLSQWALGFYSGLATAGAEADSPAMNGLDAALHRLLRDAPDIRVTINERIVSGCRSEPDAAVAQIALYVLNDLINED